MKKINILLMAVACGLMLSCGRKSEVPEGTIITTVVEPKVSNEPREMGDRDSKQQVEWGGKTYTISIRRQADKEMPQVKDQTGNAYYDNTVSVEVDGPDGGVFSHQYRKGEFRKYVDTNYIKDGESVLISVVFKEIGADGQAKFIATVGSPDEMDDNFMMVEVSVAKGGSVTMKTIEEE